MCSLDARGYRTRFVPAWRNSAAPPAIVYCEGTDPRTWTGYLEGVPFNPLEDRSNKPTSKPAKPAE